LSVADYLQILLFYYKLLFYFQNKSDTSFVEQQHDRSRKSEALQRNKPPLAKTSSNSSAPGAISG
jgi:hypothetical protein